MIYTVNILRSARKQLEKIDRQHHEKVFNAIRMLSENPRPAGSKKLAGRDAWRIRIGDYRVIYEINDNELLVLVVSTGHRKEIYR